MLSSGILDFAIGLVFTFLAMSLAAGAATEAFSSFLKKRSTTLMQGIKDLLNDADFNALAGELYQHGLINPRGKGSKPGEKDKTNPSYIDPGQFAAAFLDIIKGLPTNTAAQAPATPQQDPVAALKAAVDAKMPPQGGAGGQPGAVPAASAPNDQIRNMLHGIIDRAKGDEDAIRKELSTWFDNSMDRVSGSYKRWTQVWNFCFAFGIAVVLNVNTLDVAETLWKQPIDTKAITAVSDKTPPVTAADKMQLESYLKTLNDLNGLPIGWPPQSWPDDLKKVTDFVGFVDQVYKHSGQITWWGQMISWLILSIVGWAITAFATLFGAPFWFDALQQIVRLKGSGPSPGEKVAKTAAANGKAPGAAAPA